VVHADGVSGEVEHPATWADPVGTHRGNQAQRVEERVSGQVLGGRPVRHQAGDRTELEYFIDLR